MRKFAAVLVAVASLLGLAGFVGQQTVGFDTATGSVCLLDKATPSTCHGIGRFVSGWFIGSNRVIAPNVVANDASAATFNSTRINAAIQVLGDDGGGTVQLPCGVTLYTGAPLTNDRMRVFVDGCGPDHFHDTGSPPTGTLYGTTIKPTFAGEALVHTSRIGSTYPYNTGGGFRNLVVDGNGIATRLLRVTSVRGGVGKLTLLNSVGTEAAWFGSLVNGTQLAEAGDVQYGDYDLRIRQLDGTAARAADGVVLTGDGNSVSVPNFSFNRLRVVAQVYNGNAIVCKEADNNFIDLIAYVVGTGRTLYGYGATSGSVGCGSNTFEHVSGNGPIYMRGTSDGDTAGVSNKIGMLDSGNGTPAPTAGTGSYWTWFDGTNIADVDRSAVKGNFADSVTASVSQRGWRASTSSIDIINGSADHIRLRDTSNTNQWGAALYGNNLRFVQFAGSTGIVMLPGLQFGTRTVSTLPGCNSGAEGILWSVTDATSATFGASIAGGGSNHVLAYCNGTSWVVR